MVTIGMFRSVLKIIYIVRRKINQQRELTAEEHEISVSMGVAIVKDGIDDNRLELHELMAAIFVVNYIFKHRELGDPALAKARKDALNLKLIGLPGIKKRRGRGRFRKCIEIEEGPFIAHVPRRILKATKQVA